MQSTRRSRRGAMALAFAAGFLVMVLGVALVLNWGFLVLVHRSAQQQLDAMALSSVAELLDDSVLEDNFTVPQQAADLADAELAVHDLRERNNENAHARLHLLADDVEVLAARVTDVTAPAEGSNLQVVDVSMPPHPRVNTLIVHGLRSGTGDNAVQQLIRGFGIPDAQIETRAYATLDSRVVGYRPTATMPAPVAPLAISYDAWYVDRLLSPVNMNNRRELVVSLKLSSGGGTANAALIGVDGLTFNPAAIADQVAEGLLPFDLGPSETFGPVGPGIPPPQNFPAEETSPAAQTADIQLAFQEVVSNPDSRRIFPIYASYNAGPPATAQIVGFVAANVLEVIPSASLADPQLRLRVEPAFYIHAAAITDPQAGENPYVHIIRKTR